MLRDKELRALAHPSDLKRVLIAQHAPLVQDALLVNADANIVLDESLEAEDIKLRVDLEIDGGPALKFPANEIMGRRSAGWVLTWQDGR